MSETSLSKFSHLNSPGFQMTFENGMTISVIWHIRAYCSRKSLANYHPSHDYPNDVGPASSPDAEVAAWYKSGEFYQLGEHDNVVGYRTTDEVADLIQLIKNLKP